MNENSLSPATEMEIRHPYRKREGLRGWGFAALRMVRVLFPEGGPRNLLRRMTLIFKQNIPREFMMGAGDTIVQVGTPQTETLRRISRNIGPKGHALIVEADETNVQRLRQYANDSALPNVAILHRAAADQQGELEFLVSKKWSGNHRLADDSIVNDNDLKEQDATGSDYLRTVVAADRIENICRDHSINSIDYIEIAVNGAELKVLQGMTGILPRTRRLFVKGHSRDAKTGQPINREIRRLLDEHGFRTFLTKKAKSVTRDWGVREGDVYAWR